MKKILILLVMLLGCSTWAQSVPFAFVQGTPSSGGRAHGLTGGFIPLEQYGNAFEFVNDLDTGVANQATNFMTCSSICIQNNQSDYTISAWVKYVPVTYRSACIVSQDRGNPQTVYEWLLFSTNPPTMRFVNYQGGYGSAGETIINSNITNTWTLLTLIVQGGTKCTQYTNLVAISSNSATKLFTTAGNQMHIGVAGNAANHYYGMRGTMDNLAIWSNALTMAELTNLYNNGSPLAPTGAPFANGALVALWKFDEPEGSTVCTSVVGTVTNTATLTGIPRFVPGIVRIR